MTNLYKNHYLRRWTMNENGIVGCFHDAIDTRLHSQDIVNLVEAHNELLLNALQAKKNYENALLVQEPETQTIVVINENGTEIEVANPEYTKWLEAQNTINNVSANILAWINSLNEPSEDNEQAYNQWVADVQTRNTVYIDTAPSFTVVTDGPALYPLSPSQFWGMVYATDGLKDAIDLAISGIVNPLERSVVKARFERATEYNRDDPLFSQLAPVVGLTEAEIDAMWMQAKNL